MILTESEWVLQESERFCEFQRFLWGSRVVLRRTMRFLPSEAGSYGIEMVFTGLTRFLRNQNGFFRNQKCSAISKCSYRALI